MLFAIGFVSLFVTGGLSGIFLAQPAVETCCTPHITSSAHFHIVMGVAAIFGIFAATYYWFPKMFGRMMNERLAKLHFWMTFAGAYCIFMPMHFIGIAGGQAVMRIFGRSGLSRRSPATAPLHDCRSVYHGRCTALFF